MRRVSKPQFSNLFNSEALIIWAVYCLGFKIPMTANPSTWTKSSFTVEPGLALGLESFSDWLSADSGKLLNIMSQVMGEADSLAGDRLLGPVFGAQMNRPRLIPATPESIFKQRSGIEIDLLIGTTMDETRYYSIFEDALNLCEITSFDNPLLDSDPLLSLGALIMSHIVQMDLTNSDSSRTGYSEGEALLSLADEIFFRIPTTDMVNAHTMGGSKTYAYILDYPVNFPDHPCLDGSSPHGSDLAFVFDRVNDESGQGEIGKPSDASDQLVRESLVEALQDAIVAFAKTGNPNVDGSTLGYWPRYAFAGQSHLVIDGHSGILNRPFWLEQLILKVFGLDSLDF